MQTQLTRRKEGRYPPLAGTTACTHAAARAIKARRWPPTRYRFSAFWLRSSVVRCSVKRSLLKRISVVFCPYFVIKSFVKALCIYCVLFGSYFHFLDRFITGFLVVRVP